MRADDRQIGGNYYKNRSITPWMYIDANDFNFYEGNILKYLTRYKDKDGIKDLRKLKHYVDKLIELQNRRKK